MLSSQLRGPLDDSVQLDRLFEAQLPLNIVDINPTNSSLAETFPTPFAIFNDIVFFACDDGSAVGVELCSSAGNANDTGLFADINVGAGFSFPIFLRC